MSHPGPTRASVAYLLTLTPAQEFEAFNPNEMVVRLLRWDEEAGCIKYDEGVMVKVEGDQAATVGQLKVLHVLALRVLCSTARV